MSLDWRATYRLQLRGGIDFAAAQALLPYLSQLGASHLYLSPVAKARTGSTHGYDVVDPNLPDPALGGTEAFERLLAAAATAGIGVILDIVPNHMAIGHENPWWRSLLELGQASPHAAFFDVEWFGPDGQPQPLELPVLGAPLEEVIRAGELTLALAADRPTVELAYFAERFPLHRDSLAAIDPGLPDLLRAEPLDRAAVTTLLGRAATAATVAKVVELQVYRPAFWQAASQRMSYRRFFNITELAGLRVEVPEVFDAAHHMVVDLVARGLVQGLRVDHIDGLNDPTAYLADLRRLLESAGGQAVPIWVEKILGPDEALPEWWPVAGTTGYEFGNAALGVLIDPAGLDRLTTLHGDFTGNRRAFGTVVGEAKEFVLHQLFPAEFARLGQAALAAAAATGADLDADITPQSLADLLGAFTVYRSYVSPPAAGAADRAVIGAAVERAAAQPAADATAIRTLGDLLTAEGDAPMRFAARFQQLSGPVMAKSLEDTAFYRWYPLLAMNEVGGEPGHAPTTPETFHAQNAARLEHHPDCLLASSTHDTKRGEDARARLAVLSECPEIWAEAVGRWWDQNGPQRKVVANDAVPDPATEYLLYQSLVGAWPPGLAEGDADGLARLRERMAEFATKAMREAKDRTSWSEVDQRFEAAVQAFLAAILTPSDQAGFLPDLVRFVQRIEAAGVVNALAQTLLKLTSAGLPDLYQGSEGWDFSLVDPDNRRPVDFTKLAELATSEVPLAERLAGWRDASVKVGLVRAALALRAERPALFARGDYLPIEAEGEMAANVLAFARQSGSDLAITVVPRLTARWVPEAGPPLPEAARWGDTALPLAEFSGRTLVDRLTGRTVTLDAAGRIGLVNLLDRFPVALLAST